MSKTTQIMLKECWALSIVAPNGVRIAQGLKTLEVRSWKPDVRPLNVTVRVLAKRKLYKLDMEHDVKL